MLGREQASADGLILEHARDAREHPQLIGRVAHRSEDGHENVRQLAVDRVERHTLLADRDHDLEVGDVDASVRDRDSAAHAGRGEALALGERAVNRVLVQLPVALGEQPRQRAQRSVFVLRREIGDEFPRL